MIDLKAFQNEMQQARQAAHQARIEAQLAAADMEEQTELIRQTPPNGLWPELTRRLAGPHLFVFAS